jgi:hypothetical protein
VALLHGMQVRLTPALSVIQAAYVLQNIDSLLLQLLLLLLCSQLHQVDHRAAVAAVAAAGRWLPHAGSCLYCYAAVAMR